MKLKITSLFLFLVTLTQAQVVTFTDGNFYDRVISSNSLNFIAKNLSGQYFAIDSNNDGEVQLTEALQVKELNVSSSNIMNLQGIRSFTNLTHLNCEGNFIGSLNVDILGQLVELKCGANQLTTLTLGNHPNMRVLSCYSNLLPELNVANLTNLETLYCYENNLSTLYLGAGADLVDIQCNDNQLTGLNVSNFTALRTLYCYDNILFSVNIEGATNIRDFRCNGNFLTNIETSDLGNMTYFNCGANPLISLNLTGLTFLQALDFSGTPLTIVDASDCIFLNSIYSRFNSSLQSLYIKNNHNETTIDLTLNTGLVYVCCDASQLAYVQNQVSISGATNCSVNSNCDLGNADIVQNISIYPNPVKDFLYFSEGSAVTTVTIYDLSGRAVITQTVLEGKTDLSSLKPGTYLMKMTSGNTSTTSKIVKN